MQRRDVAGGRGDLRSEFITALGVVESGEIVPLPGTGRIAIGSDPDCEVVLRGDGIAPVHCTIERGRRDSGGLACVHLHPEQRARQRSAESRVLGRPADAAERAEPVPWRPGTPLRVGPWTLIAIAEHRRGPGSAFARLRGRDPALRRAVATAVRAASSDCSVLILGETGTGKELIARTIHDASRRAQGPLVALNCGAISGQLIGSELFGHARGAFTGAAAERDGLFVQADGGTLFLDELGELPTEQQPHLLRALETRSVRRIGANREQAIDVRLVAATNRMDGLGSGASRLRLDLVHRVATVVVALPPLRQRPGDIPLLVRAFLDEFAADFGHHDISPETLERMCAYPWPGNVRELRAAVQRGMALCTQELRLRELLPPRELAAVPVSTPSATSGEYANGDGAGGARPDAAPSSALAAPAQPPAASAASASSVPAAMAAAESADAPGELAPLDSLVREQMRRALERCGSIRRAAHALGIPKSTFADRARRLGVLPVRRQRAAPGAAPPSATPVGAAVAPGPR
ncbi:sigma 54-dependent Fis family transcriptional regulator [Haliangium ochraceum]|uniref:Sigma 54 interacting domain protein n=1 Tax=Haliangium ochraceum (strain DSM 14365 / JCM 11303 / SMP-2) TaxID=502025 RepID=D0LRJ2_HALO1|nr:sigma 54-dependent Fis family transcriptional regulator [Haliangium ochraceum]ACY17220.1 Sigma 54 interacting domain protein [Haliangium ochraceum DSM 14365]